MANSPQIVMSVLYFTYNGLFASILLAVEWDGYAQRRKGPCVSSSPAGAQAVQVLSPAAVPVLAPSVGHLRVAALAHLVEHLSRLCRDL